MRLYYSLTSPYARKVRIVLLEKQLQFDGIDVAQSDESPARHNPLGKVPTLVLDDGTVLFDSTVITETLDALFIHPRLIPSEPLARAAVRRWEALGDGICDVAIPVILDARRPPEHRDIAYATRLEKKLQTALEYLDRAVLGHEYLAGGQFSLADVGIVTAVGYLNLRRPELLRGLPELQRYVDQLLARPSLKATIPPNLPVRG